MLNTDQSPERSAKDYKNLSRWQVFNHLRTEKTKPENRLSNFFKRALWAWIYHTLKSRFGPKHSYPEYKAGETGIYNLSKLQQSSSDEIKVAIASDWATNTPESFLIGEEIAKHNPDYSIHVGDTYYVGEPKEISANFLPVDNSPWFHGNVGSFAVLGNHEMYARGIAFFDDLLPKIGIKKEGGSYAGQGAGFFCLENKHWRIIGLDTGYHSIGIPIIEFISPPDCHLDAKLMTWLKNTLRLDDPNDKRGLLILTHHQYISAFKEGEYIKPAQQLASLIGKDRPVLWLCGHEHKFSIFEKTQVRDAVSAYVRCIGHGGMPIEFGNREFEKKSSNYGFDKLVFYDKREYAKQGKKSLGFNGYVLLKVIEDKLSIEYYDIKQILITEHWTADGNGSFKGEIIVNEPKLDPEKGKDWADAVK